MNIGGSFTTGNASGDDAHYSPPFTAEIRTCGAQSPLFHATPWGRIQLSSELILLLSSFSCFVIYTTIIAHVICPLLI
jgi:hypothetical protein